MGPFQTLRDAIIFFFLGFPIIIISLMGFLSVGIGNVGLILLVIGQIFVVPLAVLISHFIGFILSLMGLAQHIYIPPSHIAQLVPNIGYDGQNINVFPSYWVAQTVFFFAYLFTNAYDVFNMRPMSDSPSEEWRVNNRRSRAAMIMGMTLFTMIFMVVLRYTLTDIETFWGTFYGIVIFSLIGVGWYKFAILGGARKGDIFGIVQQMVPIPADQNVTMCAPVEK